MSMVFRKFFIEYVAWHAPGQWPNLEADLPKTELCSSLCCEFLKRETSPEAEARSTSEKVESLSTIIPFLILKTTQNPEIKERAGRGFNASVMKVNEKKKQQIIQGIERDYKNEVVSQVSTATSGIQARLRKKVLEKQKNEAISDCHEDERQFREKHMKALGIGIQRIVNSSYYKENPIESAEEIANKNADELVRQEEIQKNKLQKKRLRNKKRRAQAKERAAALKQEEIKSNASEQLIQKKEKPLVKGNKGEKEEPVIDPQKVEDVFFANLQRPSQWRYRARVSRWKESNPEVIRSHRDRNRHGKFIQRYAHMKESELLEQRAKHYLPGTERLLKAPYIDIYACKTQKGYGMVAEFTIGDKTETGMLYVGCDNSCIYHSYFEKMDFQDSIKDLFEESESEVEVRGADVMTSQEDTEKNSCVVTQQDGIITFQYSENYSIRIFPLRSDLLAKHLPTRKSS